jgi:hypothetical protein
MKKLIVIIVEINLILLVVNVCQNIIIVIDLVLKSG